MTDQTTDDKKVIQPENYPLACIDCATHMIWDKRLLIKRDEYEWLKEIEAMYEELCK